MASSSRLKPAIFLDRDGVIVHNRADYVKTIDEIELIPGALASLAWAAQFDYLFVVVSNQSAVARGLLTSATLTAINAHVHQAIIAAGGRMDGWYVCPHRSEDNCECRKPKPGMLLSAAADLGIDLLASVMIGDAVSDVQAGHAAGTQAILVRTGRGVGQTAELHGAGLTGVPVAADLTAALRLVAADAPHIKTPPDGGAGQQSAPQILPHNPLSSSPGR